MGPTRQNDGIGTVRTGRMNKTTNTTAAAVHAPVSPTPVSPDKRPRAKKQRHDRTQQPAHTQRRDTQ